MSSLASVPRIGPDPRTQFGSELRLLALCCSDAASLRLILDSIRPEHFQRPRNRTIYAQIEHDAAAGDRIDSVSLAESLEGSGRLAQVGGVDYVFGLAQILALPMDAPHWIRKQLEAHQAARLTEIASSVPEMLQEAENPSSLCETLTADLRELQASVGGSDTISAEESVFATFTDLEELYELRRAGKATGISTGFDDLDEQICGGLRAGEYSVLAARPSMGKSAIAVQIALSAAEAGVPGLFFSLEMGRMALMLRIVSLYSRIGISELISGTVPDSSWSEILSAAEAIAPLPIRFDHTPGLTVEELRVRARRSVEAHGTKLILVDYLTYLRTADPALEARHRVEHISQSLKELARELDVHVLCLSQLNRGVESRQDKRPMMSDLRDSGAIEQDADLIAMLYRDEYYNTSSEDKGVAEVIIAKQRQGPTGTVRLAFQEQFARFADLARD